jgi:hypothetical protein
LIVFFSSLAPAKDTHPAPPVAIRIETEGIISKTIEFLDFISFYR